MVQKKTIALLLIVSVGIGYFSVLVFEDMTSHPLLSSNSLITKWTFETGDDISSSPALYDIDGDGKLEVIAGSNDNKLYALNGEDGSELWAFATMGDVSTAPAIADLDGDRKAEIVVAGSDGTIHVINGEDGSRLWTPPVQMYSYEGNMIFEDEEHRYLVLVDSGAESMHIILTCGSNDYDLYIGHEYDPTIYDYDYRGYTGSGEDITISFPEEGTWHLMVKSFSGTGEYQLSIAIMYEGETEEETYQFQGYLENEGDIAYHYITIPEGATEVHMILTCSNNDFDLYGGLGYQPTTSSYDFRGFSYGSEDLTFHEITPGSWTLMVHSYEGVGLYRLIITITITTRVMSAISGNLVGNPIIVDLLGDGMQKVILASMDGNVYCMQGDTGEIFWECQIHYTIASSPSIADLNEDGILDIIVSSIDGWLVGIDGATGTNIWYSGTTTVNSIRGIVTADINGDSIDDIIATSENTLFVVDGRTGTEIWSSTLSTSKLSVPALMPNMAGKIEILVGSEDGILYKINSVTGDTTWFHILNRGVVSTPCVADVSGDGLLDIIIPGSTGWITAIDSITREVFWEFSIPGAQSVYLAIADIGHDGNLDIIVGCDTNRIYAIEIVNSGQRVFWQGIGGDPLFTRSGSLRIVDGDSDMLSTYSESYFGSSPSNSDTDSDQIPDGIEIALGLSPLLADTDFDSLNDFEETYIYHTSGRSPDTDNDLLNDNLEILVYFTNPLSNDTDNDGLIDGLEILVYGSSPFLVDSDNDSIPDGLEVHMYGSSPAHVDTDLDSIPDYDEIFIYHTSPNATDTDKDLLYDAAELFIYNSNPLIADTDGDGAIDGIEVYSMGTEVLIADTDGDNYLDGWEHVWGFDPLDANVPLTQPLLFYGPYITAMVIIGLVSVIGFRWNSSKRDDRGLPENPEMQDVPTIPKDTIYDLMDGVEKPWLHDGRDPLMEQGDIHDFMQWLVKEESYANALIDGGAMREGVERLERLLKYVEQEQELLTTSRGQTMYSRTRERIAKRIEELRTIMN